MRLNLTVAAVRTLRFACAAMLCAAPILSVQASSHREAPFITTVPKVDATDFYLFNSYESGRTGFVTLIANYLPLQDPYGGPNYFSLDPNALYEIHVDHNGDAREDLTFQFQFRNNLKGITLPINGQDVGIPLIQSGAVSSPNSPALNLNEQFTLTVVRGDRRKGTPYQVTNAATGATVFDKPVDNIGTKTIANYNDYAAQHVYSIDIPGCSTQGRLFVGQRKEPFAVNLGTIFDLVNAPVAVIVDPTLVGVVANPLDDKNITTLALEVSAPCLRAPGSSEPVIGGWTSASLRTTQTLLKSAPSGHQTSVRPSGNWQQVSRLGMPLVNEVVIGLMDKDRFNSSEPYADSQFATYVATPTLPELLEIALASPDISPTNFPRTDLIATFLTGIRSVNRPNGVVAAEMLRLNTATPTVPRGQQNRLGLIGNYLVGGNDFAGFPNGRRPNDDVVDISLAVMMGGLCFANGDTDALGFGTTCKPSAVPLGSTALKLHDAVNQASVPLLDTFPYLFTPTPGAQ